MPDAARDWTGGRWLNEPASWRREGSSLLVSTDPDTDFWRETHYGFVHDSGHALLFETTGDFTASVRVRARYDHLYDQAGLMVRVDAQTWIKAGIEMSDGRLHLGSVLTAGRSDWATFPYEGNGEDIRLRVTVRAGALRLQASADGLRWPLLRLCPFAASSIYEVGPMCCTPGRSGLAVRFDDFRLGPPSDKDLHDLS
jgi:uncharacterized protein